jgi:hypothetical protein
VNATARTFSLPARCVPDVALAELVATYGGQAARGARERRSTAVQRASAPPASSERAPTGLQACPGARFFT